MDAKMQLAHYIIAGFHGEDAARKASDEFNKVVREKQTPNEIPTFPVSAGTYKLLGLLVQAGLVSSRTEAERLIRWGSVEIEGQAVDQMNKTLILQKGESLLLKAGKRKFLRVVVE